MLTGEVILTGLFGIFDAPIVIVGQAQILAFQRCHVVAVSPRDLRHASDHAAQCLPPFASDRTSWTSHEQARVTCRAMAQRNRVADILARRGHTN